jgi:F-type H+-transporting ATPase subunit b
MNAIACALFLWMSALPAWAAAAEAHGPDWTVLAFQVLNTAILVVALVWFTREPIRDFLARRRSAIAGAIAQADGEVARARAELERLRTRLATVEREAAALLRDAEERAEAERERALARVGQVAARVREEARRVADQEIERARQALREEAGALAVSLASELLQRSVRTDDDVRLVREYSARVGEAT